VPCGRAQVRTCPVPRAATRARRAPCGSRPRRRAAPRRPPRASPFRTWRPTLPTRGAATTSPAATMRTSTPTRSAPAPLTHSCCAPPPPPVRRRTPMCARMHTGPYRSTARVCSDVRVLHGTQRVLKGTHTVPRIPSNQSNSLGLGRQQGLHTCVEPIGVRLVWDGTTIAYE
jgi:hypothetical protein